MRSVGRREVGVSDSLVSEVQTDHSNLDTTYNKILGIYLHRKLWEGGQVGGGGGSPFLPGFFNENGPATYDRPWRTQ